MKNVNKNHFFFNHKGIKGHAAFDKKPSKKVLKALFAMVELASKIKTTNHGNKK